MIEDRQYEFTSYSMNPLTGKEEKVYGEEDARQKALRALSILKMPEHANDVVRMECFNREERDLFERVFREVIPAELMGRVVFSHLEFKGLKKGGSA